MASPPFLHTLGDDPDHGKMVMELAVTVIVNQYALNGGASMRRNALTFKPAGSSKQSPASAEPGRFCSPDRPGECTLRSVPAFEWSVSLRVAPVLVLVECDEIAELGVALGKYFSNLTSQCLGRGELCLGYGRTSEGATRWLFLIIYDG